MHNAAFVVSYKSRQIRITLDDHVHLLSEIINISAGRTRYIASGIKVAEGIADDETEVEFDGDPAGFLPCRISIAPDPLQLISAEGN